MLKNKLAKVALIPLIFLASANSNVSLENIAFSPEHCYAEEQKPVVHCNIKGIKQTYCQVSIWIHDLTVEKEKGYNTPLENIPVEIRSTRSLFFTGPNSVEREETPCVAKTDHEGCVHFDIVDPMRNCKGVMWWYPNKEYLLNEAKNVLRSHVKNEFLERIDFQKINFDYQPYTEKITVRTLARNTKESEHIEFVDEEKESYIKGIRAKSYISLLANAAVDTLKSEFESKYKTKKFILRVVGEDLCPLEDAVINFGAVKAATLEEITSELSAKRREYLLGTEFSKEINFDPSYLISNLDGKEETVSKEGMPFVVNVPSEYEISVIKEGYKAVSKRVKFRENMEGKMNIKMSPLGRKVGIHFDFLNNSDVEVK